MIGGSVSKVGIQTTKDVTPFVLNSVNATTDTVNDIYINPSFQIAGISQSIKIKISFDNNTGDRVFCAVDDAVGEFSSTRADLLPEEFQPDNTLNILPGKYLIVGIFNDSTSEDRTITLLNNNSGDAVLTTITGNVTR